MLTVVSALVGAGVVALALRWPARWIALVPALVAFLVRPSLLAAVLVLVGVSLFVLLPQ